jgi:predicted phosphate transport protein (TIGR00153 family)
VARKKQFDYFGALEHLAKNAHQAAELLEMLTVDYSLETLENQAKQIHQLEHEADAIVRSILSELYVSFITPIDREDIVEITERLDDVLDTINSIAYLLGSLVVTELNENVLVFITYAVEATAGVLTATKEFAKFKNSKTLHAMIDEVSAIEGKADKLYSDSLKELFTVEQNPIEVIKWKNVYDKLEELLNASEAVVDVISGLVIKNS